MPTSKTEQSEAVVLNGMVLGTELDLEDQFEITALDLPDLEEDEETEIVAIDTLELRPHPALRLPFMSFLFRNL